MLGFADLVDSNIDINTITSLVPSQPLSLIKNHFVVHTNPKEKGKTIRSQTIEMKPDKITYFPLIKTSIDDS